MKLWVFVVRRLLLLIPVLVGVSIIVFALTGLAGPRWTAYTTSDKPTPEMVQSITEEYHLNDPQWVQYLYWMNGIIHGDWGYSKAAKMPVTEAIAVKFPATFELAIVSIIFAVIIGLSVGTLSAVKKDRPIDHTTRMIALIGVSLPIFWLGLILLNLFYFQLGWLPRGERVSLEYTPNLPGGIVEQTGFYVIDAILMGDMAILQDVLWHLILPAITLSFASIAILTRIMRSSMLETLNQDYVKTARSKGLPEKIVIKKHARRNALIPFVTTTGLVIGGLLTGAVLTETIFNWPGLGRWSTQAIQTNDLAAIMGFTLMTAIIIVIVNLIVDVAYAYLDPRVVLE
jgi:ABC-type dipeptide/oligopeptide/nickel transport system permease component